MAPTSRKTLRTLAVLLVAGLASFRLCPLRPVRGRIDLLLSGRGP